MNNSTVWQLYRMSRRATPWAALLMGSLLLAAHSWTPTGSNENEQQEPTITGTIRTSDGSPLYGIRVSAKRDGQNSTTSVFTDDQGVYEFPPLSVGSYRVSTGTLWSETVNLTSSGVTQYLPVLDLSPIVP